MEYLKCLGYGVCLVVLAGASWLMTALCLVFLFIVGGAVLTLSGTSISLPSGVSRWDVLWPLTCLVWFFTGVPLLGTILYEYCKLGGKVEGLSQEAKASGSSESVA